MPNFIFLGEGGSTDVLNGGHEIGFIHNCVIGHGTLFASLIFIFLDEVQKMDLLLLICIFHRERS